MTSILPHGDVGRLINSFVCYAHPDALEWQRGFRQSLYNDQYCLLPFLSQLSNNVYLVATKHLQRKYVHAIRLPDYRRIISRLKQPELVVNSGIPKCWYPQGSLRRISRVFRGSPVYTNNYVIENPEPLPWEI